ncbi:MAG: sulfite exporter TauE/SafE family protein [Pseudomonadota bacterium]
MIDSLFPAEIEPLTGLALMAISFGTSFITAAFGIGGGVVLIGVLAVLLPPAALIPVHGVVQMGSNTGRAFIMRQHVSWPILGLFAVGTLVGVAIGGVLVVDLPPAYVQIGIALFVLWSIIGKPPKFMAGTAWIAGGTSSFLTMFFGATGPFVAAYIKTLGFDRMTHSATHAMCMVLQHGLKILAFGVLGFAFGPYIVLIVGMIAFGFLGTLVGKRVLMKIDEARFKLALNAILIVLSLRLLWAGATDLI